MDATRCAAAEAATTATCIDEFSQAFPVTARAHARRLTVGASSCGASAAPAPLLFSPCGVARIALVRLLVVLHRVAQFGGQAAVLWLLNGDTQFDSDPRFAASVSAAVVAAYGAPLPLPDAASLAVAQVEGACKAFRARIGASTCGGAHKEVAAAAAAADQSQVVLMPVLLCAEETGALGAPLTALATLAECVAARAGTPVADVTLDDCERLCASPAAVDALLFSGAAATRARARRGVPDAGCPSFASTARPPQVIGGLCWLFAPVAATTSATSFLFQQPAVCAESELCFSGGGGDAEWSEHTVAARGNLGAEWVVANRAAALELALRGPREAAAAVFAFMERHAQPLASAAVHHHDPHSQQQRRHVGVAAPLSAICGGSGAVTPLVIAAFAAPLAYKSPIDAVAGAPTPPIITPTAAAHLDVTRIAEQLGARHPGQAVSVASFTRWLTAAAEGGSGGGDGAATFDELCLAHRVSSLQCFACRQRPPKGALPFLRTFEQWRDASRRLAVSSTPLPPPTATNDGDGATARQQHATVFRLSVLRHVWLQILGACSATDADDACTTPDECFSLASRALLAWQRLDVHVAAPALFRPLPHIHTRGAAQHFVALLATLRNTTDEHPPFAPLLHTAFPDAAAAPHGLATTVGAAELHAALLAFGAARVLQLFGEHAAELGEAPRAALVANFAGAALAQSAFSALRGAEWWSRTSVPRRHDGEAGATGALLLPLTWRAANPPPINHGEVAARQAAQGVAGVGGGDVAVADPSHLFVSPSLAELVRLANAAVAHAERTLLPRLRAARCRHAPCARARGGGGGGEEAGARPVISKVALLQREIGALAAALRRDVRLQTHHLALRGVVRHLAARIDGSDDGLLDNPCEARATTSAAATDTAATVAAMQRLEDAHEQRARARAAIAELERRLSHARRVRQDAAAARTDALSLLEARKAEVREELQRRRDAAQAQLDGYAQRLRARLAASNEANVQQVAILRVGLREAERAVERCAAKWNDRDAGLPRELQRLEAAVEQARRDAALHAASPIGKWGQQRAKRCSRASGPGRTLEPLAVVEIVPSPDGAGAAARAMSVDDFLFSAANEQRGGCEASDLVPLRVGAIHSWVLRSNGGGGGDAFVSVHCSLRRNW